MLQLTDTYIETTNTATHAFTADIGSASLDRLVIVACSSGGQNSDIGDVYIGGVLATTHINASAIGWQNAVIASRVVTTGTTATVSITTSDSTQNFEIAVYTATDLVSNTPTGYDGGGQDLSHPISLSCNVANNGIIIGAAHGGDSQGAISTSSNPLQSVDYAGIDGFTDYYFASSTGLSADSSYDVVFSRTNSNVWFAAAIVAWEANESSSYGDASISVQSTSSITFDSNSIYNSAVSSTSASSDAFVSSSIIDSSISSSAQSIVTFSGGGVYDATASLSSTSSGTFASSYQLVIDASTSCQSSSSCTFVPSVLNDSQASFQSASAITFDAILITDSTLSSSSTSVNVFSSDSIQDSSASCQSTSSGTFVSDYGAAVDASISISSISYQTFISETSSESIIDSSISSISNSFISLESNSVSDCEAHISSTSSASFEADMYADASISSQSTSDVTIDGVDAQHAGSELNISSNNIVSFSAYSEEIEEIQGPAPVLGGGGSMGNGARRSTDDYKKRIRVRKSKQTTHVIKVGKWPDEVKENPVVESKRKVSDDSEYVDSYIDSLSDEMGNYDDEEEAMYMILALVA
jgi:trimeric autotransporter adhesin